MKFALFVTMLWSATNAMEMHRPANLNIQKMNLEENDDHDMLEMQHNLRNQDPNTPKHLYDTLDARNHVVMTPSATTPRLAIPIPTKHISPDEDVKRFFSQTSPKSPIPARMGKVQAKKIAPKAPNLFRGGALSPPKEDLFVRPMKTKTPIQMKERIFSRPQRAQIDEKSDEKSAISSVDDKSGGSSSGGSFSGSGSRSHSSSGSGSRSHSSSGSGSRSRSSSSIASSRAPSSNSLSDGFMFERSGSDDAFVFEKGSSSGRGSKSGNILRDDDDWGNEGSSKATEQQYANGRHSQLPPRHPNLRKTKYDGHYKGSSQKKPGHYNYYGYPSSSSSASISSSSNGSYGKPPSSEEPNAWRESLQATLMHKLHGFGHVKTNAQVSDEDDQWYAQESHRYSPEELGKIEQRQEMYNQGDPFSFMPLSKAQVAKSQFDMEGIYKHLERNFPSRMDPSDPFKEDAREGAMSPVKGKKNTLKGTKKYWFMEPVKGVQKKTETSDAELVPVKPPTVHTFSNGERIFVTDIGSKSGDESYTEDGET